MHLFLFYSDFFFFFSNSGNCEICVFLSQVIVANTNKNNQKVIVNKYTVKLLVFAAWYISEIPLKTYA